MLFMLLVFLCTYLNWAAGVCFFSFLLNILLILFAIIPIIYTIVMVVMRDTCANVEFVGLQALKTKLGEDSMGYKLAHFYLADGTLPNGTTVNIGGLVGSINPNYDIDSLKVQVNQTIADAIDGIKSGYTVQHSVSASGQQCSTACWSAYNFVSVLSKIAHQLLQCFVVAAQTFKVCLCRMMQVQAVLDDVVVRVNGLLTSVDGLIDLLDYPSVSGVIMQVGK